eukprot:8703-Heterococcus_DN1.PRE.2
MPQLTLCEEMRDCFGFQLVCCILQTTIVSPKLIARACIGKEDGIVHSGAEALDGEALPKMQQAMLQGRRHNHRPCKPTEQQEQQAQFVTPFLSLFPFLSRTPTVGHFGDCHL